jgi:cell division septation protein DedD
MGQARNRVSTLSIVAMLAVSLAGCDENGEFLLGQASSASADAPAAAPGRVVERDVEAPDVFSATEAGLWDGRPSLGGVWVAHPDVTEPERVIIRNLSNGKFVVGALFRRERDIPGPRLQISSDAAAALGMLAGAPQELNVTALRREEVTEPAPATEAETVEAPADVETAPLDPIAAAGAALDDVDAATAAPTPKPSSLSKPYIQVGIFSVEDNANRTAAQMRSAGMVPTVRRGETGGKSFWRVIVGPAGNSSERRALLDKIKSEGFTDAYPVTN